MLLCVKEINQLLVVVFNLVSIATHCFISVTTHSKRIVWVYRPESKPSHSAVCFHSTIKAFIAPAFGNDTQLHVIKLPYTFLSLLQDSLFSFPPDDTAGSVVFFCLSVASREEGWRLMFAYSTACLQDMCPPRMRFMSNTHTYAYSAL